MSKRLVAVLALLTLLASPALAEEKGGPFTVFSATVRIVVAATTTLSDVPTLVRYDPKSGRTWVMVPPAALGSAPYWVPVVDPIEFGTSKGR
jgi:hypothetical protein